MYLWWLKFSLPCIGVVSKFKLGRSGGGSLCQNRFKEFSPQCLYDVYHCKRGIGSKPKPPTPGPPLQRLCPVSKLNMFNDACCSCDTHSCRWILETKILKVFFMVCRLWHHPTIQWHHQRSDQVWCRFLWSPTKTGQCHGSPAKNVIGGHIRDFCGCWYIYKFLFIDHLKSKFMWGVISRQFACRALCSILWTVCTQKS